MAGQTRFRENENLPARISGLLFDSRCEALIVDCTRDEIIQFGLPFTKYDIAILGAPDSLPDDVRALIDGHVAHTIAHGAGESDPPLLARIDQLLSR